jgi:itaconate CoA-transferase
MPRSSNDWDYLMSRPLDGLVVVALEQAVAVPFATRQLADLGARVIKIEREGVGDFARSYDDALADGYSSWFAWLNRGKQSITLDVKQDNDLRTLHRLIDRADVFLQNLAPGAADRLGCAPDVLRARNPKLITVSLSGYGPDGPYRDRKAYDLLIQAEAGMISLTGTADEPSKTGLSVADIAGGMYAYSNTLAALIQRGRTGEGAHIDVSLFDSLLEWLGHQTAYTRALDVLPRRAGARHATILPYGPYPCGDGQDVVVVVQNAREWVTFCNALDLAHLADDPRFNTNPQRLVNIAELDALLIDRLRAMTADQLIVRLEGAGLPWARLNDMRDVLAHPQLAARNRWQPVDTPVGPFTMLRPPLDISSIDVEMGTVPSIGQHTQAILSWLDEPE